MGSVSLSYCQTSSDSISMKRIGLGGYAFYQGDKRLSVRQVVSAMESNELAYYQMRSAQSNYTIALILAGSGGALIG